VHRSALVILAGKMNIYFKIVDYKCTLICHTNQGLHKNKGMDTFFRHFFPVLSVDHVPDNDLNLLRNLEKSPT
jgi:hypothetical protein